jgi:DNA polymerase-3 subunit delta
VAAADRDDPARRAVEAIAAGGRPRACLVCGEDAYLRGQAARALGEALLPEAERTSFNFRVVDGGEEDARAILASLRTYPLFGGTTVLWVERTRLLASAANVGEILRAAGEAWGDASRRDDEAGRARAARDVLRVLAARDLGLAALDPSAPPDESLGPLLGDEDAGWLAEVHRYCLERDLAPEPGGGEAELAAALEEGWPEANVLVLVAEVCDRRLRLFRALQKHGLVVDVGGAPGGGRDAEPRLRAHLDEMARAAGGRLSPGAHALLLRKVGFDLSRLQSEVVKLATYVGEGRTIDEADVEAAVGWTREEGQWELANAVQERDLARALRALRRTLDQGAAPVRLFFQIASKVRDVLAARALVEGPLAGAWRPGMDFRAYQARVRPRVDAILAAGGGAGVAMLLRAHPWALFKALEATDRYRRDELVAGLEALYRTNWELVRGGGPPAALLEQLVVSLLAPGPGPAGRAGEAAGPSWTGRAPRHYP